MSAVQAAPRWDTAPYVGTARFEDREYFVFASRCVRTATMSVALSRAAGDWSLDRATLHVTCRATPRTYAASTECATVLTAAPATGPPRRRSGQLTVNEKRLVAGYEKHGIAVASNEA